MFGLTGVRIMTRETFKSAAAGQLQIGLISTARLYVKRVAVEIHAVLLGIVFLDEQLEARHLLALCLILAGVLVSQLEYRRPRSRETASEARSVV